MQVTVTKVKLRSLVPTGFVAATGYQRDNYSLDFNKYCPFTDSEADTIAA